MLMKCERSERRFAPRITRQRGPLRWRWLRSKWSSELLPFRKKRTPRRSGSYQGRTRKTPELLRLSKGRAAPPAVSANGMELQHRPGYETSLACRDPVTDGAVFHGSVRIP